MSAVELATKFNKLRLEKKNDEAAAMIANDAVWIVPTMTGQDTYNGLDAIKAFWAKQELPKVVKDAEFTAVGENVAERVITISKMMMKFDLRQTVTFNSDMKITKFETKKA